jgi:hypothetical protein
MPHEHSLQEAPQVVSMPVVGTSEVRDSGRHAFPGGESKDVAGKIMQMGVNRIEASLPQQRAEPFGEVSI